MDRLKWNQLISDKISMATYLMLDNIYATSLPAGANAYAGYVGGSWPDDAAEKARFPGVPNLSIAVNSSEDADCLDIESGDATVADAPAWFNRQRARGLAKPWLYTSLSSCEALVNTMTAAGIARTAYFLWSAHYTYVSHICSPTCGYGFTSTADGTQWTDAYQNCDASTISEAFYAALGGAPAPAPAPTPVPPAPKPAPAPAPVPNTPAWRAHHNTYTPVAVDGNFGPKTCAAMQYVLGVAADGNFGPITKEALQRYLHVAADGIIGPITVAALQRHVGATPDGNWGPLTTEALQRALNAGTF